MNAPSQPDPDLEQRLFRKLLDVFIRAGLIFAMTALCYRIFSPFVSLMVWALILAVTLYPAHQKLARQMGGRLGWAATLLVLLGLVLIGAPTALLMSAVAKSLQAFIASTRWHPGDSGARARRGAVAAHRSESGRAVVAGARGPARHPARRARRAGQHRHHGDVHRRGGAGPGLPALHGVGGDQSRLPKVRRNRPRGAESRLHEGDAHPRRIQH